MPIILKFAAVASLYVPSEKKVHFVFDRNQQINFASVRVVEYLKILHEHDFSLYIDDFTFASRDKVGIQAADLLAYEAMKDLDNHLVPQRQRRLSMQALLDSGKFEFRYWDKESFERHKQEILNFQRIERLEELKWDDYEEWLSKQHCLDNVPNRLDYMFKRRKNRKTQ